MYVEAGLGGAWYAFQAKRAASAKRGGVRNNRLGPLDTAGVCGRMRKTRGAIKQEYGGFACHIEEFAFYLWDNGELWKNYKWKTC